MLSFGWVKIFPSHFVLSSGWITSYHLARWWLFLSILCYFLDWPAGWPVQADVYWLTCHGCPLLTIFCHLSVSAALPYLSSQSFPDWSVQAYLSGWTVQTDLTGSSVLAVRSWLSYTVVLSWLSCTSCPVLYHLLSFPGYPAQLTCSVYSSPPVVSSRYGCPAAAVLFWVSSQAGLSWLSCPGCCTVSALWSPNSPVAAVLSRLSCSEFLFPAILSWMPWPSCDCLWLR